MNIKELNEAGEQKMKWIHVDERLPPLDFSVLVAKYDGRKNVNMYFLGIARRYGTTKWVWEGEETVMDPKYGFITHWMLLPVPPALPKLPNL